MEKIMMVPPTGVTEKDGTSERGAPASAPGDQSERQQSVDTAASEAAGPKAQLQVGQNGLMENSNMEESSSGGSRAQQPAGESSVSEVPPSQAGETKGEATDMARASEQRSRSETTLTSYEELEGQLKENANGSKPNGSTINPEGQQVVKNDGQKQNGQEHLPPTTDLVAASEDKDSLASSEDSQGPPKVITTTSAPGQSYAPLASSSTRAKQGSAALLRRGKWTVEEEAYVARVIQDFNSGFLDAPAGTTLRTYLSEKLQCDPMRITKKFTGDACIGKRVFHPAVRSPSNASSIDKAQMELDNLERRWRRRMEMQQKESAKKAAASAAHAAVIGGRGHQGMSSGSSAHEPSCAGAAQDENVVARTASWLDRANSVLKDPSNGQTAKLQQEHHHHQADDLRSQMQELEGLINEGPAIQQTSAGLPEVVDKADEEEAAIASSSSSTTSSSDVEPADKRMRTAEDAEALVGFLRSVRASAASGQD